MTTEERFNEIAIVGAGPLGLSLALALKRQGRKVCLFDARPDVAAHQDARVLALSEGSRQLLGLLGAWPVESVTPIETIHVSQRGALGRTTLTAQEHGLPALGYVVPMASLMKSLVARVTEEKIETVFDARVQCAKADEKEVTLHIDHALTREGSLAKAQLVAFCEGGISPSKEQETLFFERDYHQNALLCCVTPAQSHQNRAYERFTPEGPIAFLPMGRDFAVVWTVSTERFKVLQTLSDSALLSALQVAFGPRVQLVALKGRAGYPLALCFRKSPIAPRTVWLGNAAQTLHPVAGQGLNLALRDVWALTQSLAQTLDVGNAQVLARYAKGRRVDRVGAMGFSDTVVRVFSNDHFLLKHGRGAALLAMDMLPPLRHFVARRMMFGARAWF